VALIWHREQECFSAGRPALPQVFDLRQRVEAVLSGAFSIFKVLSGRAQEVSRLGLAWLVARPPRVGQGQERPTANNYGSGTKPGWPGTVSINPGPFGLGPIYSGWCGEMVINGGAAN
jgi:hypothetical protein